MNNKIQFDMSLIWARVSLFIMEFLIFGKPYSDNTTDIDKTNKQNNNVYFQNFIINKFIIQNMLL